MLGKPLSHLRPLLRLQTHAQPDLFTSNPSLLHHFPQQGGHAVVQAGPSSAQAAGQNAGNAGRAGWGGGAGTGGNGYTGHARAFLGLPQTTSVDPSSSLNDETKEERALMSTQRRFQAARFAQTQVAPGTLDASEGRRRIEGREGGLLRAIAMEEASEVRSLDPEMAARFIAAAAGEMAVRPKRRSSIAYPQAIPAIARTVSPIPTRRKEITRSSSSMDVWIGSGVIPRPQLRAYSSRTSTIPLPGLVDEAESTLISPSPSSRARIPQPNRVLMDLAGRDLPPSSSISRRYNSSLATQPPLKIFDDLPLPPMPSAPAELTPEEQANEAKDLAIYKQLIGRVNHIGLPSYRAQLQALIAHYRSSRTLAPLDERQVPGDPALVEKYPLPTGFSTSSYNACLEGLMVLREPGESIARILEAYNEMLERDVLPNMRTYQIVIRALCARESDIWHVVSRWKREQDWAKWRMEGMGRQYQAEKQDIIRDQLIEGYVAEGNLDSALRLFSAARTFQNNSHWRAQPLVYHTLLKTIATQARPTHLNAMREVFNHALSRQPRGALGLYRFVFETLGRADRGEELELRWADFRKAEHEGQGQLLSHWMEVEEGVEHSAEETARRIKGARVAVYQTAIKHFARLGNMEKVEEIVALVQHSADGQGWHVSDICGALLVGMAGRDAEAAVAKYAELEPIIKATSLGRLPIPEAVELVDELVAAGQWRKAYDIIHPDNFTANSPDFPRIARMYQAIVIAAHRASSPNEAKEILDHLPLLLTDKNYSIVAFPLRDHFAVLQQHGLWLEAESAIRQFRRHYDRLQNWASWFVPFVQAAAPHMSLQDLVNILRSGNQCGMDVWSTTDLLDVLADKYVGERTADPASTADLHKTAWEVLLAMAGRATGPRLDDGGYDQFLTYLAEDMVRRLQSDAGGEIAQESKRVITPKIPVFTSTLKRRFGEEQAQAMLQGVAGTPAGSAGEAMSASETAPSISEFSLPSPPTSATTVSTSPPGPPSQPKYIQSRGLSQSVDTHQARHPRMTAEGAYKLIYQELEQRSEVPYAGSIARVINSLGREGADDKVSNLYALAQAVLAERAGLDDPQRLAAQWCEVENHMLIASCHLGHLERAGVHRQRIIDAGMIPSADAYATMIASSKDTTDDALVARALFDESQRLGVVPNLYLYNTIISKLSKARKAELSLELFAHMKAAGIEPSSVTYGAVINACCRVGDAQSAETLFDDMRAHRHFKPRVPPYNTMMQFFVHNHPSRAKVLHYHSLLRHDNVSPSAHTYKLLMDAYATLPPIDLVSMERVYADLLADRRVQPQATHLASLITAYGIYGDDLAKAMEIFESHSASASTHDAIVWEAVLNVVAHRGTLADLEAMRQRMEVTGIRSTAYVYNVLITGYARARRIDEARRIFESMGDSVTGVAAPNNHPILLTGSGYAKPQTTTEEPTTVVFREPSTYEAMVRAEMTAGDVERAQEVVSRMEARGYPWAVFMRVKAIVEDASVMGLRNLHGQPPARA